MTPQLVSGGYTFSQVVLGGSDPIYTTACALTTSHTAYCWGMGTDGQLGNGGNASSTVPVAVTMPTGVTFSQIAVGGAHVSAVAQ